MESVDARRFNVVESTWQHVKTDHAKIAVVSVFGKNFRTTRCVDRIENDDQKWYLFLNPEPAIAESFNLTRELLCLGINYSKIDARTFNIIDKVLEENKTRVDQDTVFLVTDAPNAESFIQEHTKRTGRKVLLCSKAGIAAADEDFSLELLRRYLHSRDLFDVTDPVSSDAQFFARFKLVDDIFDTLASGQNCGVYGLRKIGKTSVIDRIIQKNALNDRFRIARIDAQEPEIYANDAAGVAIEVCRKFDSAWAAKYHKPFTDGKIPKDLSLVEASRYFRQFTARLLGQGRPLLVIIDELERILPNKAISSTWATEYLHLWRLLRSESQNSAGKFVFLLASTNPYFTETPSFENEDNPLYRFVRATYLTMFEIDELTQMLQSLGRPMGVSFEEDAIREIFMEFGGSPFLSRQLCSHITKELGTRPLHVTKRNVEKGIQTFRAAAREDMDAILKVLADFYPEELALLRSFHSDTRRAYRELEANPLATKHLLNYGLLKRTQNSYKFTMQAMPNYFAVPTPTEFKRPEVPQHAINRHQTLQKYVNQIEPLLRHLVMFTLKAEFKGDWQSEVLRHCKEATRRKIETLGDLPTQRLLEELYFPDLLHTMLANWKLFASTFESRDTFKQKMPGAELAREMSAHNKLQLCADDAKFLKACDSCDWFLTCLT